MTAKSVSLRNVEESQGMFHEEHKENEVTSFQGKRTSAEDSKSNWNRIPARTRRHPDPSGQGTHTAGTHKYWGAPLAVIHGFPYPLRILLCTPCCGPRVGRALSLSHVLFGGPCLLARRFQRESPKPGQRSPTLVLQDFFQVSSNVPFS